jgi:hypothetical protein
MDEDLTIADNLQLIAIKQQLSMLISDRLSDLEDYQIKRLNDFDTELNKLRSQILALESEVDRQVSFGESSSLPGFIRLIPKNRKKTLLILCGTAASVLFFTTSFINKDSKQAVFSGWISSILAGSTGAFIAFIKDSEDEKR